MRCLELEAKFVVDVEADVLAKLLVDIYYHFEMWCSIFFYFFIFWLLNVELPCMMS